VNRTVGLTNVEAAGRLRWLAALAFYWIARSLTGALYRHDLLLRLAEESQGNSSIFPPAHVRRPRTVDGLQLSGRVVGCRATRLRQGRRAQSGRQLSIDSFDIARRACACGSRCTATEAPAV
jgi:hypothetical protein